MSITWTPTILAAVDDAYDRDRASDGRSRFGVYLHQRAASLRDGDAPLSADEFAAVVWRIATAPVMSPGYVRIRPDVRAITPAWSDDGQLMFDVHLPLSHRALSVGRSLAGGWRDWHLPRDPWGSDEDSPYWSWVEPDGSRPALLTTTVLRLTVDDTWNIPTPSTTQGAGLVADAKRSMAAVADAINQAAGPIVATLRGERP